MIDNLLEALEHVNYDFDKLTDNVKNQIPDKIKSLQLSDNELQDELKEQMLQRDEDIHRVIKKADDDYD